MSVQANKPATSPLPENSPRTKSPVKLDCDAPNIFIAGSLAKETILEASGQTDNPYDAVNRYLWNAVHLIEASRRESNKLSQSYDDLFHSYKMLWDQSQNLQSKLSTTLDVNTQLLNSISTGERLKAALEFELQEVKDKNAAFGDWHSQEIQDKDVEIAILEEEIKVLREQGAQPEVSVAIPSDTSTKGADNPAAGNPERESSRPDQGVESASSRREADNLGLTIIENPEPEINLLLHENTLLLQKLDYIRNILKASFPNLEDGFGNLPFLVACTGEGEDRKRKCVKGSEQSS